MADLGSRVYIVRINSRRSQDEDEDEDVDSNHTHTPLPYRQHKVDVPSQFTSEEFMTRVGGLKRYFIFMHGWLYRHSSYNAAAPTPFKEGLIDRALSKAVSGGLHAGEVGLTAT